MENNVFSYNYSATKNKEVESIRRKYMPKEENLFERLKKLDLRVQTAGIMESLCIGIVGVLIFGLGMCFGLDALAGADWLTVVLCVVGIAVMIPAYPVYKRISRKTREELAPEILSLSEQIMKNESR